MKNKQPSHVDGVQGDREQRGSPENLFSGVKKRTEPYLQYVEGVAERATQQESILAGVKSATSTSGAASSAGRQARVVRKVVVGIDEVGRGCWAGPLVAGAVILDQPIAGLRDSKKLSKKQRDALSEIILGEAKAYGLGWVWPKDIDAYGITTAVKMAMEQALAAIKLPYDEIIIDGNYNFLAACKEAPCCRVPPCNNCNKRVRTMVKADDSVPAVSAASIIAKVARDNWMTEAAEKFSEYGFEKHVGYGTKAHVEALQKYGPCEIHRFSYRPIAAILRMANEE